MCNVKIWYFQQQKRFSYYILHNTIKHVDSFELNQFSELLDGLIEYEDC